MTLYQENTYLIQKKGPGWYRFIHRCGHNDRGERIWADNEKKLNCCDYCRIPIPPRMILLWEMIDKAPAGLQQAIYEKVMQVPDGINYLQGPGCK